jgi:hypothetical protein
MTLSEYEARVIAELEVQLQADAPAPRRDYGRLALPLLCFLGGAVLLAAVRSVELVHGTSDLFGFATASVRSGLSLAGHVMLLGSAFLLGRALYDIPGRSGDEAGTQTVVPGWERV